MDRQSQVAASYDRTFAEEGLSDSDRFYQWALEKLHPEPGGRLLDVACGEGKTLGFAIEAELDTVGVDLSTTAVQMTTISAPESQVALANGESLPFGDDTFDYVTSLGSLEHYLDPWTGIGEIRRVLRPEGIAGILLPNSYYLADIIWHVLRKGRGPHHRQVVERFATRLEWANLLEMMGLKVDRTYRYNFCWPRTRTDWAWYRRNPRKWLYLLSGLVTPLNLSYSFYYLCQVAEPRPELNAELPLVLRRPETS